MRETIINSQRGTRIPKKPEDYAHASIMHRRKSINFGFLEDSEFSLAKLIAYAINIIFVIVKLDYYFQIKLLFN
jgi:hypothetical protein